jgi:hypothetical protein
VSSGVASFTASLIASSLLPISKEFDLFFIQKLNLLP